MNRRLLVALLIALSLIGIADAWYLAESAATDTALVCDIGGSLNGCNVVAQSPYSKVFGIPLADFGVAFYAVFLLLTLAAAFLQPRKLHYHGIAILSILSALMSICFLFIQFFLIQALCIYCILSAAITFLCVPLSYLLWKNHSPLPPDVVP
jgi:uncharacterized membrane protein